MKRQRMHLPERPMEVSCRMYCVLNQWWLPARSGGGLRAPQTDPGGRPRSQPKGLKRWKQNSKPTPRPRRSPTPGESEEETPPPRKRRAPRHVAEESQDSVSPEPPTTRDIADEVLSLLSNRHVERSAAKRDKYRSWFQQL